MINRVYFAFFIEQKKETPEYRERFSPGDKCGVRTVFFFFSDKLFIFYCNIYDFISCRSLNCLWESEGLSALGSLTVVVTHGT